MALMLLSLFLYIEVLDNEAEIAEAVDRRYQSYLLADELRQSSDDLTRMARTYSVTGDPKFKEYFDRILAIRSGEAPRPVDYQNIYWDFVSATGVPPRVDTHPRPLKKLMKEAEFTETELALLQETENESNELVNLENRAMNAMVGLFEDGAGRYTESAPDRELARNLLHGEQYHRAKVKIMTPLEKFFEAIDHRTTGAIAAYRDKQRRLNVVLMITLGLSACLALVSLVLGGISMKKKDTDDGRSRLAQRLAASGYTSSDSKGKGSARDALVRRLTGKAAPAQDRESKQTAEAALLLQFFFKGLWHNWPLISAAVFVTFLTLGLSWWFLSENRIQSYTKARDELKFTLDATHSAVLDWLYQTRQGVSDFAEAGGRPVTSETLQSLKDQPQHFLHQQLAAAALPEQERAEEILTKQDMLAKILRRGFLGNYGEVYLVDSEGRFISEPRWKEQIFDKGWANPDTASVVGMYASQQGKADKPSDLPISVRRVTAGESGEELEEYDNYLGQKVIGTWDWNNTYGFGIINEFRSEEAFATYRAFSRQTMAGSIFTAALILTLTLMSIWSRNKVNRTNEQLSSAFKTIKSHNDKLAQDLRIGQKVQTDMLPDPIEGEGFTLEAFLKPAQSVSGDFYDFSMIRDGKVYFCVGDVSGKGIPASLFMSMSKALLSKVLDQTDQTKDIITRVNNELSLNNDSNMFVTLIIGVIDLNTGQLLITNAGHNLPYIKKHTGELICLEEVHGPLVGTFEGIEFKQQSIKMSYGDMILFYTDGVTEALNIRDEFYEDDRLKDLLEKNDFDTAKDMTNAVFRSVLRFIGRAAQFDDITILSFQYTGL